MAQLNPLTLKYVSNDKEFEITVPGSWMPQIKTGKAVHMCLTLPLLFLLPKYVQMFSKQSVIHL